MKTVIHKCDLCKETIEDYVPGGEGLINGFSNQVYPMEYNNIDICKKCCLILRQGEKYNIVKMDLDGLYISFGYEKINGIWTK